MTEQQTIEQTPNQQPDEAATAEAPEASAPAQGIDSLPDWAQRELRTARDDAASYRTRLREAEDKLKKAKTPEEFDAARDELTQENLRLAHSLAQRDAAAVAQLPPELAARLEGSTPEELAADAERLKTLLGTPPSPQPRTGPGGGGLNPTEPSLGDLGGTPREVADRMRKKHGVR